MLNAALVATRDGIAGYWDGKGTYPAKALGKDESDINYLRYRSRGLMLDHEMMSAIEVYQDVSTPGQPTAVIAVRQLEDPPNRANLHKLLTVTRPEDQVFLDQLKWLRSYADLRDDRLPEVQTQIDDLLSFFGSIALIDTQRRTKTMELLEAVVRTAIFVEFKVKHICRTPRPIDFSDRVQPMIQTPDHSSFPSGHATEAFAIATVLYRLRTKGSAHDGVTARAQEFRLAHRIASNRTVAGVHFPVDSAAGALLGCLLGEYIHALANGEEIREGSVFGAGSIDPQNDFSLEWLQPLLAAGQNTRLLSSGILGRFWKDATAEWREPS